MYTHFCDKIMTSHALQAQMYYDNCYRIPIFQFTPYHEDNGHEEFLVKLELYCSISFKKCKTRANWNNFKDTCCDEGLVFELAQPGIVASSGDTTANLCKSSLNCFSSLQKLQFYCSHWPRLYYEGRNLIHFHF